MSAYVFRRGEVAPYLRHEEHGHSDGPKVGKYRTSREAGEEYYTKHQPWS
jgi:hypothetical protein